MKTKILFLLLLISIVANFTLGYFHFLDTTNKDKERLAMDLKCAEFLPDLKKDDERNTKIDSEGVKTYGSEVFFSPNMKACLSIQRIFVALLDGSKPLEIWTIKNLFTNQIVNSSSWSSTSTYPADPNKLWMIDKINELKKDSK